MRHFTVNEINDLAKEIHQNNVAVGWWDDPDVCLLTKVQLISTEVAEATEGERKNLFDDHLPMRKMGEVELADALIRTLDLGAYLDLHYQHLNTKFLKDIETVGAKHFMINRYIVDFGNSILSSSSRPYQLVVYSQLVKIITDVAETLGYDIRTATLEKLAYNKVRADHKREARATENGKKF